jgi:predicted dehydrogenase
MKLKAGIIGLGSIGAFIDTPSSNNIASHTKAYITCKKTELIAAYEPNGLNIKNFKQIWKKDIKTFENLKDFFDLNLDIVSIASPTKFHLEQLNSSLNSNINYILCEKPLVENLKELEQIENKLLVSNKKILINLIREYAPSFLKLKKELSSKRWGEIVSFEAFCTKGLLHNGIHIITLISSLISQVTKIEPIFHTINDDDINGDFIVYTKILKGYLKSIKELNYSEFYLTIWMENGKIEIKTDEIICYKKTPSQKFIGYNNLIEEYRYKDTLKEYQLESLKYLLSCKDTKTILKKELLNHRVIFETIEKAKDEISN